MILHCRPTDCAVRTVWYCTLLYSRFMVGSRRRRVGENLKSTQNVAPSANPPRRFRRHGNQAHTDQSVTYETRLSAGKCASYDEIEEYTSIGLHCIHSTHFCWCASFSTYRLHGTHLNSISSHQALTFASCTVYIATTAGFEAG